MATAEPAGMALRGNAEGPAPGTGGRAVSPPALAQPFASTGAGAYPARWQAYGDMNRTVLRQAQTLASVDRF